jgi:TnpA family transposase
MTKYEAQQTPSRLINHATIFTELITYLNNQKIIVPPYTVMQDLITMVINIEERRLGNIINEHLPKQLEITLMEMLLSGKDLNLTSFKKIPKNFKYMAFRGELIKGENFKEAYYFAKKFLQKASISEYNIKYYARVAEKHNIAQLKKIKTTNAKLYLLCYIYYRYQQINDNLVICYNYYVDKFDDECKAHVMQKLIEHSKNYQNNLPKVSQLLRFMGEEEAINMGHDAFYNKANQILDKSEYKPTADYIDGVSFNEKRERWEYYGHISNRIKKYCRPVIRYLDLEYDKSSAPIEEVVTFLKGELSKKKISLTKALQSNLPTAFIKKGDGKYIRSKIDGKIVYDIDKYEIYAYLTLSKAINSGKVYCNESIKYKSLKSDLLSDEIWKDKGKILKDLGYANIEISASDKLDKLEKLVDEKIWQVNENINNGNNKYFKKDGDKWSVGYQAKGEDINHKFFQAIEKKSIVEVLHYVDAQTKFCESFNHIKTKYVKTKKEDDYIIACVIANGLGHGLYSMSQTSDISISTLMNYESNYLTVENLKKANDAVTNKIKELAIFKEWHIILDKLMGSVDGQKHESKYQTIQSRHSQKYFGLKKGIVAFNFVVNYVAINSQVISPNEHESHYLFDTIYNNSSKIDPDVITGDMHSINCLNYAILDAINKSFVPNFNNPQEQTISSLKSLKHYNKCYLNPKRLLNRKLIEEQWDDIQRVFASLVMGKTTQSIIVSKLSSSKRNSRLKKALSEYNEIFKTLHLLDFIDNHTCRSSIRTALNRVESYHKLKRAVMRVGGGKFIGRSVTENEIWNQCARLITNCIIYYNALLIDQTLATLKKENKSDDYLTYIKSISPIAWTNINMNGRYQFKGHKEDININESISILKEYFYNEMASERPLYH